MFSQQTKYNAMENIVIKIQLLKSSLSHVPTEFQGQPQNDKCCNAMPEIWTYVEILVNNLEKDREI